MQLPPGSNTAASRRAFWLLVIGLCVLYFGFTWARPLSNPDEGRYVEIPREMVASGDWITPRLNGVVYYYKPPLFYWLVASSIKVADSTATAVVRFWPAALALLGVLATAGAASRLYGKRAGFFTALVLGTSALYFGLGQLIILDMAVSVFITFALLCFLLGVREDPGRTRRLFFLGFYAAMALAVMTKGLIGIVIPAAVIFLWMLSLNRWGELRRMHLLEGIVVFALIAVPWHVAAARASLADAQGRGFSWFYFWHEHVLRYVDKGTSDRAQPFWFFFLIMPGGFFPWVVFLPQAIARAAQGGLRAVRANPETALLLLWPLFVLLFFSASSSKLIPYILPGYAPVAILLGRWLAEAWEKEGGRALSRGCAVFSVVASIAGLGLMPFVYFSRGGKTPEFALPWYATLAVILAVCGVLALTALLRKRPRAAFVGLAAFITAFCLVFNPFASVVQRHSTREAAAVLRPLLKADDKVFTLGDYYQDFPVYLARTVGIADNLPKEQQFGLALEDHAARYLTSQQLAELMRTPQRVFVLARHDQYNGFAGYFKTLPLTVLFSDEEFVVFANRPAVTPQP